jgi:ABC-type transport system substrate-binding protein
MTVHTRPLNLLARALVLVLAVATPVSTAGQAAGLTMLVAMHASKSPAIVAHRCAKRNRSTGSVHISGYFQSMSTTNLNPYQGAYVPPGLLEGYFVYNNHLKLLPQMAREVPTLKNHGIRDGGKTIVLHLKQGLRWSNGSEITAADARFGALVDVALNASCTGFPCGDIKSMETPDRYTVVFYLTHVVA